jgi:hypothetical protein
MKTPNHSRLISVFALLAMLVPWLHLRADDTNDAALKQLMRRYGQLQQEAVDLSAAKTVEEQFLEVRGVVGEICETLEQTGKDSEQVAGKIQKLSNVVRDHHAALQRLVSGVGAGLERTGKSAKEVADMARKLDQAMGLLEGAVRARNMNGAGALREFEKYFSSIARLAKPLVDRIPVLGTFLDIWSRAITAIAADVGRIEQERDRRQRLARELTGRALYLIPRTERENLGRRLAAKLNEIEGVERELRSRFADRVERVGDRYALKDSKDVAMERQWVVASRSVSNLSGQVERASSERGSAHTALQTAKSAQRAAANAFDTRDAALLDRKQVQLRNLGPSSPYRDPSNATEDARRKAREEWFKRRDERARLSREVQVLERKKQTLADAAVSLRAAQARWEKADKAYRDLEAAKTAIMRRHMLEQARQQKWSMAELERKYPTLFKS